MRCGLHSTRGATAIRTGFQHRRCRARPYFHSRGTRQRIPTILNHTDINIDIIRPASCRSPVADEPCAGTCICASDPRTGVCVPASCGLQPAEIALDCSLPVMVSSSSPRPPLQLAVCDCLCPPTAQPNFGDADSRMW